MVLGVGAAAFVYALATPTRISLENDKKTAAALARAKEALIGYAARYPDKPGILPCPDSNNNGSADSPCGAIGVTAIGRLPWRTLGLPDLRDGSGECLWYAVSANFKNSGGSAPAVVNSDSAGTLVVNDTSGTPIYSGSNAALAIVFAPGGTLPGQDRSSSSTTVCGGNTTVANYLDSANQSGAATNIFVTSQATDAFNDKLLPITSDALFNVVNVRVAKEARKAVSDYRAANGYYPRANRYDDPTFNCENSTNSGRLPLALETCTQQLLLIPIPFASWGSYLPPWFSINRWNTVTHYAVSPSCTSIIDGPLAAINNPLVRTLCDTVGYDLSNLLGLGASSPLSVDVNGSVKSASVVLFVTGQAMSGQTHTCPTATQCLEPPNNGDTPFTKPARFPTSNDRMAAICATSTPCDPIP